MLEQEKIILKAGEFFSETGCISDGWHTLNIVEGIMKQRLIDAYLAQNLRLGIEYLKALDLAVQDALSDLRELNPRELARYLQELEASHA